MDDDFAGDSEDAESYWGYESNYSRNSERDDDSCADSDVEGRRPDIAHELLQGLKQFREAEMFCDITLQAGDVLIPAHKIVLCACSPYFSAMFSGRFKEKDKEVIVMEGMDGNHLKMVIDYIYTGQLYVTAENVRVVLDIANFLQINSAQEICCDVLSCEITPANCLEFIEYGGKRSLKTLLKNATKCAAKHFCQIVGKDEFSLLDFEEIDLFLQEDELNNFSDDTILFAIHKWISYSPKDRLKYLSELLVYVKAGNVTKSLIQESEYLKANVSCEDWLLESEKSTFKDWHVYFFNRLGHFGYEKVPLDENESYRIKRLPEDLCQSSYTAYGGTIYVQGGWISQPKPLGGYSDLSFAYNTYKDKWTKMVPLNVPRSNHRSCVIGGSLYTLGGSVNLTSFDIVERLDLITCQYVSSDTLRKPRSSFGLVVYDNCIYIVGGNNREQFLTSVERFDPRVGTWEVLSSEPYSRGECSCAVFQDNIYATFGRGGAMERFDVKANQWIFIKKENNSYPCEIFSVGDKLFGTSDKGVYTYAPEQGKWQNYRRTYPYTKYLTGVAVEYYDAK